MLPTQVLPKIETAQTSLTSKTVLIAAIKPTMLPTPLPTEASMPVTTKTTNPGVITLELSPMEVMMINKKATILMETIPMETNLFLINQVATTAIKTTTPTKPTVLQITATMVTALPATMETRHSQTTTTMITTPKNPTQTPTQTATATPSLQTNHHHQTSHHQEREDWLNCLANSTKKVPLLLPPSVQTE